jgi:hypothetical protein
MLVILSEAKDLRPQGASRSRDGAPCLAQAVGPTL